MRCDATARWSIDARGGVRGASDCATSCFTCQIFLATTSKKFGAKRRHPVDASGTSVSGRPATRGERRVKSRDGLSMAKRGLSNSEDQTKSVKSAKSAKKKAEAAETARDAATGSRVYTVEYEVDTTIREFDEDIMDGYAGYQGGYHEDYHDEMESAEQREREKHEVHEASLHQGVVYGSMTSAKAAAKGTFTVLCKDFLELADDDKNDEYLDRTATKFVDEYKEGNWTRLYKYNGDWGLRLNDEKCPAHKMSVAICVGIRELPFVE